MYLVPLKTLIVSALRDVFKNYPQSDFRGVNIGIEYPIDQQGYPSIWVDYEDTEQLVRAGIDHHDQDPVTHLPTSATRWRFGGTATLTVVALSSMERDRLYDEVIRVLSTNGYPAVKAFHSLLGGHGLSTLDSQGAVAVNANFDQISVQGNAAAPGTPWGTDEVIYERGVAFDLIGEFYLDPVTGDLVPLSKIKLDQPQDITVAPLLVETGIGAGVNDWH